MHILKTLWKKILRLIFEVGQWVGFDILPRHFYSEIPDLRLLRKTHAWRKAGSMMGVSGVDLESQWVFLASCCGPGARERQIAKKIHKAACEANKSFGFGPIEADFLDSFIRAEKPARVVQVGGGVATAVLLDALAQDIKAPSVVVIDPYPNDYLLRKSKNAEIELVAEKAQNVNLEIFTRLQSGDLLFVDSTHCVSPGSEVNRIVLEVLPRLTAGVWVHFHDIYFPYDYSRQILTSELFFNHESVLLHAFLMHNAKYTLRVSLSMLHYEDAARLKKFLPNYRPARNDDGLDLSAKGHFPSSLYLQVVS